jgi:hypothetical protein
LNLRGELAGDDAEAAVLDLQFGVGGAELFNFRASAPLGAKTDQHRHDDNQQRADEREPQADRHASTLRQPIR